jgi:VWFA-related protein
MSKRSNRLNLPVVLASLLVFSGPPTNDPSESSVPTYRRTVSEVRLTFFAADAQNRSLDALRKDDFAIVDNELIVRNFRSFTKSDEVNLDVVVLLDSSESVLSRFRGEITDVFHLISRTQWITDDKLSVISFSGPEPKLVCSTNCRTSSMLDRLSTMKAEGETPLFDALAFAANFLAQRRLSHVRPVIILFSDGVDTISRIGAREAMEKIRDSEAQVYVVDVSQARQSSEGTVLLGTLAEVTAGRYFSISEGATGILDAALDDLHNGYAVSYELPNHTPGFHAVRILPTRNLNLRFRCREGYYYPSRP